MRVAWYHLPPVHETSHRVRKTSHLILSNPKVWCHGLTLDLNTFMPRVSDPDPGFCLYLDQLFLMSQTMYIVHICPNFVSDHNCFNWDYFCLIFIHSFATLIFGLSLHQYQYVKLCTSLFTFFQITMSGKAAAIILTLVFLNRAGAHFQLRI